MQVSFCQGEKENKIHQITMHRSKKIQKRTRNSRHRGINKIPKYVLLNIYLKNNFLNHLGECED